MGGLGDQVESLGAVPVRVPAAHELVLHPLPARMARVVRIERSTVTTCELLDALDALAELHEASFRAPTLSLGTFVGRGRAFRLTWREPGEGLSRLERLIQPNASTEHPPGGRLIVAAATRGGDEAVPAVQAAVGADAQDALGGFAQEAADARAGDRVAVAAGTAAVAPAGALADGACSHLLRAQCGGGYGQHLGGLTLAYASWLTHHSACLHA